MIRLTLKKRKLLNNLTFKARKLKPSFLWQVVRGNISPLHHCLCTTDCKSKYILSYKIKNKGNEVG